MADKSNSTSQTVSIGKTASRLICDGLDAGNLYLDKSTHQPPTEQDIKDDRMPHMVTPFWIAWDNLGHASASEHHLSVQHVFEQ
jgi:hypothetical protein